MKPKIKIIVIFLVVFIVYLITSPGKTPYNYFTRLADAFLHGRYYITDNPSWLSELIPAGLGRFYIVYPPMPALLALPFVFLFGPNFPQQIIAHLLGAGIVILTILTSLKIRKDNKLAVWSGILIGFGSIVWYLSSVGSVWYLGQISSAFFLTAAIYEVITKKRTFLVGLFIGAAYLSRIHVIISLPFFIYALKINFKIESQNIKKFITLGFGLFPFLAFDAIYNFIRFGVPWDKGYFLVPGLLTEPWMSKGIVNIAYIPNHLQLLFLQLPKFLKVFPYIEPSWYGLAIWITTPAFVFSLKASLKEKLNILAWLAIFSIFAVVSIRGGTGWTQFGYRYAVDFYPFLVFLTIKGISKSKLKWYHWLLLVLSVIVNLWGVIMINKLGFVSF